MKTQLRKKAILISGSLMLVLFTYAQGPGNGQGRGQGGHCAGNPGYGLSEEERNAHLEDRVDYLAYKLELTEEQKAEILALQKKHEEERRKEREEMQKRRQAAFEKHQAEIKAVLTDEQKVKYDEFMKTRGPGNKGRCSDAKK